MQLRSQKALERISVKELCQTAQINKSIMKKVNEGYCAELFETEDQKILKLYRPEWSEQDVRQEYDNAKAVNELGIPSPVVYDFVEQDGRYGFVMEKLTDDTMLHHIQRQPLEAMALAKQMARLHYKIHSIPLDTHPFPTQKDAYLQKIQRRPSLTEEDKEVDRSPE